jgi:hypothetical protein
MGGLASSSPRKDGNGMHYGFTVGKRAGAVVAAIQNQGYLQDQSKADYIIGN